MSYSPLAEGPPAWAERALLAVAGQRRCVLYVIGDLREEFDALQSRRGAHWARIWYCVQMLALLGRLGARSAVGAIFRGLIDDFRWARRMLWRDRAAHLSPLAPVALACAAGVAVFSLLWAALFVAPPYPQSEELFTITAASDDDDVGHTVGEYLEIRDEIAGTATLAAWTLHPITVRDATGVVHAETALLVNADLHEVVSTVPAIGRALRPGDELPRPRTMVISHDWWVRYFSGSADVLGKTMRIGPADWRIVGVMPEGFDFPLGHAGAWAAVRFAAQPVDPDRYLNIVGRVPAAHADDVARALATLQARREASGQTRVVLQPEPFRRLWVGTNDIALRVAGAATAILILLAALGLTAQRWAQVQRRTGELTIRQGIGCSSARILRQAFIEQVLAVGAAVALGVISGHIAMRLFVQSVRDELFRLRAPDGIGVAVLMGLLLGAAFVAAASAPFARHALRRRTRPAMLDARPGALPGGARRGRGVVVLQVALAAMLIVPASVVARTLWNLHAVDPGFARAGFASMRIRATFDALPTASDRLAAWEDLRRELAELEGIQGVALAGALPLSDLFSMRHFEFGPAHGSPAAAYQADTYVQLITPAYFDVIGAPSAASARPQPGEILVNESLWQSLSAAGFHAPMDVRVPGSERALRVAGVVAGERYVSVRSTARPRIYVDIRDAEIALGFVPLKMHVLMKIASADEEDAVNAALGRVAQILPQAAVSRAQRAEDLIRDHLVQPRHLATLFGTLALLAGLSCCWTIRRVMLSEVEERRSELGVRLALGAPERRLVFDLVAGACGSAVLGVGFGIVGGVALASTLGSLLYGAQAADPASMLAAMAVLVGLTTLASLPAIRRLAATEPSVALRKIP